MLVNLLVRFIKNFHIYVVKKSCRPVVYLFYHGVIMNEKWIHIIITTSAENHEEIPRPNGISATPRSCFLFTRTN